MASATATGSPDPGDLGRGEQAGQSARRRPRRDRPPGALSGWLFSSRLGGLIILLNLLGLFIIIGGSLIADEIRQGLVHARLESLRTQGELIANVIDQVATAGDPAPALQPDAAEGVLGALFIPRDQRARLFAADHRLLADSDVVADRVDVAPLPPVRRGGDGSPRGWLAAHGLPDPFGARREQTARVQLDHELDLALAGATVSDVRMDQDGHRVVSVSIPIRHVRQVLGVLTLEASDVDQVVAAQRRALIPFILLAVGVALGSSVLLTRFIALPVMRLARAADQVRLFRARAIALPDLDRRRDELGDLARSLAGMTAALSQRMTAIERFAADVAHELRNPMTSIRSAVETLEIARTEAARQKLMAILQQDINRMDRLITDISNASRLDAELARDAPQRVDLVRMIGDICGYYEALAKPGVAHVRFIAPPGGEAIAVFGREGPLSQVLRNLIDNARSFSPAEGEVRVSLQTSRDEVTVRVDDDGPGVPPENMETVFERFYTSRPKGAAFGGNSGLGLAIARQIVETHGGRIWAENRIEDGEVRGARFVVAMPRAR